MKLLRFIRQRYALVYLIWIMVCVAAGIGVRNVADPSVPAGRIDGAEASRRALDALVHIDAERFRGMEVVSAALVEADENTVRRWVVLCDRRPRTGLRDAIVVELASRDGQLLTVRSPIQ